MPYLRCHVSVYFSPHKLKIESIQLTDSPNSRSGSNVEDPMRLGKRSFMKLVIQTKSLDLVMKVKPIYFNKRLDTAAFSYTYRSCSISSVGWMYLSVP
jgi:hypothetical protein